MFSVGRSIMNMYWSSHSSRCNLRTLFQLCIKRLYFIQQSSEKDNVFQTFVLRLTTLTEHLCLLPYLLLSTELVRAARDGRVVQSR